MPRYARAQDILRLALELQASAEGLSLEDIQQRFEVDRRTAARMRDAVGTLFPELEWRTGADRRRYWRLPRGSARALAGWHPEELAALDTARKLLERDGRPDQADALARLETGLRGSLAPSAAARVETDLDALTEAEGLAARPGPRPATDDALVAELRHAILACRKVRIQYVRGRDGERVRHKVYPYGFLHGSRHYLVAWSRPADAFLLYRLPDVEAVELLDEPFERDPAFDIHAYAERSFGVFQEEPVDVAWRFAPDAARDARRFRFHPAQEMEEQPDGSLVVRFRAGGRLEMAWHLFTWGDRVEVLEPAGLRELLVAELERALAAHRGPR